MKNLLLALFAALSIYSLASCSGKDHLANPTTNANNSANPLNPLNTSQFTWSSNSAFFAKIDGNTFSVDSTKVSYYYDTAGYNVITALDGKRGIQLRLKNVASGGLYNLGFGNVLRWCTVIDSPKVYYTNYGNVGQIYITEIGARFSGKFYFQSRDTLGGNVKNVSEGYFNFKR